MVTAEGLRSGLWDDSRASYRVVSGSNILLPSYVKATKSELSMYFEDV